MSEVNKLNKKMDNEVMIMIHDILEGSSRLYLTAIPKNKVRYRRSLVLFWWLGLMWVSGLMSVSAWNAWGVPPAFKAEKSIAPLSSIHY